MYLHTLLAFALLFWQIEQPPRWVVVSYDAVLYTVGFVLIPPAIALLGGLAAGRRAFRLLRLYPDAPQTAHRAHHRAMSALRTLTVLGFAAVVLLTPWAVWFSVRDEIPLLQIAGDLIILLPYPVSVILLWVTAYPVERTFRAQSILRSSADRNWSLRTYLDFHLRHHFLVMAVPLTIILFAAELTRGYEGILRSGTGWYWTPDVVLAVAAAAVFLVSPVLLCRIWRTAPLRGGPIRDRLLVLCRRIGFRCREIRVWNSDGLMINAAVMGLVPRFRYVLLSDALLETMDERQIEAVFGHEAGHIQRRHIQYFLLFAVVGWLAVAWWIEGINAAAPVNRTSADAPMALETLGVATTIVLWVLGFGWLSRRFEREADLFGARCATPPSEECHLPCGVHLDGQSTASDHGRVCATGAAVFASALDRVAMLNGIPHEERSWRHSSIGHRIRFLASLAADAGRAARYERQLRRVRALMLAVAVIGSAVSMYYWFGRAATAPPSQMVLTRPATAVLNGPNVHRGGEATPVPGLSRLDESARGRNTGANAGRFRFPKSTVDPNEPR